MMELASPTRESFEPTIAMVGVLPVLAHFKSPIIEGKQVVVSGGVGGFFRSCGKG